MSSARIESSHWRAVWTTLIAVYLFGLFVLLVYLLIAVWPDATVATTAKVGARPAAEQTGAGPLASGPGAPGGEAPAPGQEAPAVGAATPGVGIEQTQIRGLPAWDRDLELFGHRIEHFPNEARLFLIVIIAGALGSLVHASTSFATYVGNRRLRTSWIIWYFLRPGIGVGIALIFYFLARGGLLLLGNGIEETTKINPFGIAAIASLAGMFSKQATDKLSEVFDSLFRSGVDQERGDKLWEQKPVAAEMIKRSEIQCVRLARGQAEAEIRIEELYRRFAGQVTRLPVFQEDWSFNSVIHQSLLYKFIARRSIDGTADGEPLDLKTLNLEHFMGEPGMVAMTREAVAFIRSDATLCDAKNALVAIDGCQDVFVTAGGGRAEPVLGWLTNGMIARLSATHTV